MKLDFPIDPSFVYRYMPKRKKVKTMKSFCKPVFIVSSRAVVQWLSSWTDNERLLRSIFVIQG